jgi:thioredoxin-related protein
MLHLTGRKIENFQKIQDSFMKKFLALFAALIFMTSVGCAQNKAELKNDDLNWYINLEEAIEKAQEENKNILVNFTGSDWCVWCMKLSDEVFSKGEFSEYADDNLVLVKLDFPRKKKLPESEQQYNYNLLTKYGVRGFPTILLLDKDGNFVRQTGYVQGGAENYIKHIEESYM